MYAIIGMILVFGAVVGCFVLEEGNPFLLVQPVEILLIFGIAGGAYLISNPISVVMGAVKALPSIFTYKNKTKQEFLNLLSLLYKLFVKMKRDGQISIEADIENPKKSDLFHEHNALLNNHHAINFLCDNLKVIISTNLANYELEDLMDKDIDTHHQEATEIAHSVARVADGMPGIGIVAAVLGVVLTMGRIDRPPSEIGHGIAVAMLGTFFGILMCYGIIGPMAVCLEHKFKEELSLLNVIKVGIVSFVGGTDPMMAAEFARRIIPAYAKPSFVELESILKGKGK